MVIPCSSGSFGWDQCTFILLRGTNSILITFLGGTFRKKNPVVGHHRRCLLLWKIVFNSTYNFSPSSALQCRLECESGYATARTPLITCVNGKYEKGCHNLHTSGKVFNPINPALFGPFKTHGGEGGADLPPSFFLSSWRESLAQKCA